jgi:hypothetical protein
MRVTIIPADNQVYVDGLCRFVDCSALPMNIQAIQWNGKRGHIEFKNVGVSTPGDFRLNRIITDFSPYQRLVDAWTAAAAVK